MFFNNTAQTFSIKVAEKKQNIDFVLKVQWSLSKVRKKIFAISFFYVSFFNNRSCFGLIPVCVK